jgi:hypothetical protein
MAIRLSEREQPREKELRKTLQNFIEVHREELPDGNIKQVLMTPTGKITRIFDPLTNKIINQRNQSFRAGALDKEAAKNSKEEIVVELCDMTIAQIARVIKGDWGKQIDKGAIPPLNGLKELKNISDDYGHDRGATVVSDFLANASKWRGDVARNVKKELVKRLKNHYRRR